MPTGYTSDLYEGKPQTFEEFVLSCARGMGAFIMQRDDGPGLPRKIDPESYGHARKTLNEYKAELKEWQGLNEDEKYERYLEYAKETVRHNSESQRKAQELRERYESMLVQVKAWRVDETLQSFKEFMIDQLEGSIDFDCKTYLQKIKTFDEWCESVDRDLNRMVDLYVDEAEKEQERVRTQHEYTDKLYRALGMTYDDRT